MPKKIFLKLFPCLLILSVGCGGGGSNGPTGPGVRVVNGISTVTEADVLSGDVVISSALPYATLSGTPHNPYSIIPTGPQPITFANLNTPTTPIVSTSVNITAAQNIDAIAYDSSAPTFLQLYDNITISSTYASMRFVNASTVTGSVDIVVVPPPGAGAQTVSTIAPGQTTPSQPSGSSAYQNYTSTGNYLVKVFPAGNDTGTPLSTATVTLTIGVTWTFIVLDPQPGTTSPVFLQDQDNTLNDIAP
jgi:hypothetical protein